ncbi:MAG TPA: hypothetical protein DEB31_07890 [Clostridiales bacterium]|nr:hypothetical protein [Clostridiales bacterium]
MYCEKCGTPLIDKASFCSKCGQPVANMAKSVYHQPNLGYGQPSYRPSLQKIIGKPPVLLDAIILAIDIVIDCSFLLTGDFIWFFLLFPLTIIVLVRLINTLNSSIIADERGVAGKIKKERFQLGYHEISSVSLSDRNDSKNLLIVSGYKTYSIKLKNAQNVRDTIAHNMAVSGCTPAPMKQPASTIQNSAFAMPSPTDVLYKSDYPAIVMTDSLKQRIVEICRHEMAGLPRKRFYLFDEIPPNKLENAMKSYAPALGSDNEEKVIMLFDNSFAESGKLGFMLTTKCLYSKSSSEKASMSYIKNIAEITGGPKLNFYQITIDMDTGHYFLITMSEGSKRPRQAAIMRVLDETIRLLKSYDPSC